MHPRFVTCRILARSAPRTRGDAPNPDFHADMSYICSPHARGCTPSRPGTRYRPTLLPARAGMHPCPAVSSEVRGAAPRTRGDAPANAASRSAIRLCSPHARGWTPTRRLTPQEPTLLPARAGMDPRTASCPTRGATAPRTRGDGPREMRLAHLLEHCSPHARGWTRARGRQERAAALLPARAGMDPWPSQPQGVSRPAPRTRGDGPERVDLLEGGVHCSPHARGWTPRRVRLDQRLALLPARAGMDPFPSATTSGSTTAPRTRGDGPLGAAMTEHDRRCSPHARGWTLRRLRHPLAPGPLPARAGLHPCRRPRRSCAQLLHRSGYRRDQCRRPLLVPRRPGRTNIGFRVLISA